jgi:ABC-type transport system involved in cytochrome c biogenesis permease subunit
MDRLVILLTAAHLLIMAPKDILNNTALPQISRRFLHNMPRLLPLMGPQITFHKDPFNIRLNGICPTGTDLKSLALTALLRKVVLFSMNRLKMSHIMRIRTLSNNTAAMALKVHMEMVSKQTCPTPMVLLHSLRMVMHLLVKILAISVRAGHTAMDLAHLILHSKMVPRIPLNLALRRTPIPQLKALLRLKTKVTPFNSLSVGTAPNRLGAIPPIAMEQIVQESPAILL